MKRKRKPKLKLSSMKWGQARYYGYTNKQWKSAKKRSNALKKYWKGYRSYKKKTTRTRSQYKIHIRLKKEKKLAKKERIKIRREIKVAPKEEEGKIEVRSVSVVIINAINPCFNMSGAVRVKGRQLKQRKSVVFKKIKGEVLTAWDKSPFDVVMLEKYIMAKFVPLRARKSISGTYGVSECDRSAILEFKIIEVK